MKQETLELEPDQDGNFDSPMLLRLYDVWEAYDIEEIEQDTVLEELAFMEQFVQKQLKEMEADAESPEVDEGDPNRVAIFFGFQAHLDGFKKMRRFFDDGEGEWVEAAFDQIQQATNRMMRGMQGLLEEPEAPSPKTCLRCSAENEPQAGACAKCGAVLPVLESQPVQPQLIAVEGPEAEEAETTPNYIAVSEAHEAWSSGELAAEQFFSVIEEVRQNFVTEHTSASQNIEEEKESDGQFKAALLGVLEQNAASLEQMLQALEEGDEDELESGMTGFAEATLALIEAQKTPELAAEGHES